MKKMLLVMGVAGLLATGAVHAQSGAEVLKANKCLGCHDMDKKKVGPALKDIAAKYRDDKQAEAKLATALTEGKGHPVKTTASGADLKAMLQYVLAAK